jgi:hypothetical protein
VEHTAMRPRILAKFHITPSYSLQRRRRRSSFSIVIESMLAPPRAHHADLIALPALDPTVCQWDCRLSQHEAN